MNFIKHYLLFIWPVLFLSSCGTLEPLEQKSHGFGCEAVFFLAPDTLGIFQSEADYITVGWQSHTENAKIHYYKYCLSTKIASLTRTINWGDRDLPPFDKFGASFMAPWIAVSDSLLNVNTFETVWFPSFVNDLLHNGGLYAYFQGFSANGEFIFYDGYFSDGTFVRKAYDTISKRLFSIKDFFPFNADSSGAYLWGFLAQDPVHGTTPIGKYEIATGRIDTMGLDAWPNVTVFVNRRGAFAYKNTAQVSDFHTYSPLDTTASGILCRQINSMIARKGGFATYDIDSNRYVYTDRSDPYIFSMSSGVAEKIQLQ